MKNPSLGVNGRNRRLRERKNILPISAIIVGFNEGHLLEACLRGIDFCGEIIYVDLGSRDNSMELTRAFGARTYSHELVPSGEYIVSGFSATAEFDWILFLDPDEQITVDLRNDLIKSFKQNASRPEIGSFSAPWQFHFKGKKLHGTPWGGRRPRPFIGHRKRMDFLPETHRGRILRDGYLNHHIESDGAILHFWADSWRALIRKHIRYLSTEGGSRYRRGDRISAGGALARTPKIFWETFRNFQDSRDGFVGIGLNLLWSFYKSLALFALWDFSRRFRTRS